MKGTVNKSTIIGRLGADPEIRQTTGGLTVATLSVATNEPGPKDQSGQREVLTEWHRASLFGKLAEIAGQYLKKGALVYLEGRLKTNRWTDQQGIERFSTGLVVNDMTMLGGQSDSQQGGSQQQQPQGGYNQNTQQQPQGRQQQQGNQHQQQNTGGGYNQAGQDQFGDDGFFDDDIPF